jgi:hypothetical protein
VVAPKLLWKGLLYPYNSMEYVSKRDIPVGSSVLEMLSKVAKQSSEFKRETNSYYNATIRRFKKIASEFLIGFYFYVTTNRRE